VVILGTLGKSRGLVEHVDEVGFRREGLVGGRSAGLSRGERLKEDLTGGIHLSASRERGEGEHCATRAGRWAGLAGRPSAQCLSSFSFLPLNFV
jgi:hypothetical protein